MHPVKEIQNVEEDIEETAVVTAAENLTGDVIGDTAYSERFVLKILLKLANLNTLQDEIKEKSFEEDLCTLWDMTAERDVVLFLQQHDVLKLLNFALPALDTPRFIEIVIGIIGNMCCQKEIVLEIIKYEELLTNIFDLMKTDDTLVLIQLFRLINSSLYSTDPDDIAVWLSHFKRIGYAKALYFIMMHSTNKNLLITSLENMNTITSCCNTERTRTEYYEQFIIPSAYEAITMTVIEITIRQREKCYRDEYERALVVSVQILLNLVGFEDAYATYKKAVKVLIDEMIFQILNYFEIKLVRQNEIDPVLLDVTESIMTIVKNLRRCESSGVSHFFEPCFNMWEALTLDNTAQNNAAEFEQDGTVDDSHILEDLKARLAGLLCLYLAKCEDMTFEYLFDIYDFEKISKTCIDEELTKNVMNRVKDLLAIGVENCVCRCHQ